MISETHRTPSESIKQSPTVQYWTPGPHYLLYSTATDLQASHKADCLSLI